MEFKNFKKAELPMEAQAALFKNLMCAVLLEASRDYVDAASLNIKAGLPAYIFDKKTILKDLRSKRMQHLTDGMSLTVAHNLVSNEAQIKENMSVLVDDYESRKVDRYERPLFKL